MPDRDIQRYCSRDEAHRRDGPLIRQLAKVLLNRKSKTTKSTAQRAAIVDSKLQNQDAHEGSQTAEYQARKENKGRQARLGFDINDSSTDEIYRNKYQLRERRTLKIPPPIITLRLYRPKWRQVAIAVWLQKLNRANGGFEGKPTDRNPAASCRETYSHPSPTAPGKRSASSSATLSAPGHSATGH